MRLRPCEQSAARSIKKVFPVSPSRLGLPARPTTERKAGKSCSSPIMRCTAQEWTDETGYMPGRIDARSEETAAMPSTVPRRLFLALRRLNGGDVLCLKSLITFDDLKLHFLAVF